MMQAEFNNRPSLELSYAKSTPSSNTTQYADLFVTTPKSGGLIFLLDKDFKIPDASYTALLDKRHEGRISASIKNARSDLLDIITAIPEKIDEDIHSVVVMATRGDTARKLLRKGGELHSYISNNSRVQTWTIINESGIELALYETGLGWDVKACDADNYKTGIKQPAPTLYRHSEKHNPEHITNYSSIASGIAFAKKLIIAPPNLLTPKAFAENVMRELKGLEVDVEILDRTAIEALSMGCVLGVSQASDHPPQVMVMKYMRGTASPLAIIGKGVTFDSGGLSLKPANSMTGMKCDMAGAAAVVGAIRSLALTKSPVNVIGIVGLVENAVGSAGYRPDDILVDAAGNTVEIQNTDAEGRLILSDLIIYAQKVHKCTQIIDIATLTGAIIVALGRRFAGLFSNDETFAKELMQAGKRSGDEMHLMPLDPEYSEMLKSEVADVSNVPKHSKGDAGSIVAAEFLHRVVNTSTTWAHVDMAGMKNDGFGVRLLYTLIQKAQLP